LAKIHLIKFEEIELHALGDAIQTCARVSQVLKRFKLAEVTQMGTSMIANDEGFNARYRYRGARSKKVKMTIKMKRSAGFFEFEDVKKLMENRDNAESSGQKEKQN
jgi:hypothetical protein